MNESIEARTGAIPQAAVRTAPTRPMLTLVRREFWEHSALWIAPLAVAALLLLGIVFFRANFNHATLPFPTGGASVPGQVQAAVVSGVVVGFGLTQYVTMSVVLWFYAADCLYAERRDRSILFWKSMPVSDARTVLAKALVALAVVPVGVFAVITVTSLAALAIMSIPGLSGSPPVFWSTAAWLRAEGYSLAGLVSAVLWYAPLTAYLMLISAWARRNVQLWAILPPFIAAIVERIAFGTHYLSTWLLYRLGPGWQSRWEQWFERLFSGPFYYSSGAAGAPSAPLSGALEPLYSFTNVDLWLGLVAAAALFYAAMRVRRYRDDT